MQRRELFSTGGTVKLVWPCWNALFVRDSAFLEPLPKKPSNYLAPVRYLQLLAKQRIVLNLHD